MPRQRRQIEQKPVSSEPTYTQPSVRIPLKLHHQLKEIAEANHTSFNRELLNRLWESFDMRPHRSLEELAGDYRVELTRLCKFEDEWVARFAQLEMLLNRSADLLTRQEAVQARIESKLNQLERATS